MKITIAQLNPVIGDFSGNLQKLTSALKKAESEGSDLVIFSELFITGYPPRDLLEQRAFIGQAEAALKSLLEISKSAPSTGILCGTVTPTRKTTGNGLYNTAVLVENGEFLFCQHKTLLPTYDVFDEARYFDPSEIRDIFVFKGKKLGITICEDAWNDPEANPKIQYDMDPVAILAGKGAEIIINLSASPFFAGKDAIRYHLIQKHVRRHGTAFFLVNQVGGNDELLFDGKSLVLDPEGRLIHLSPAFSAEISTVDTDHPPRPVAFIPQEKTASVFDALVMGIRDYMSKCDFSHAVLGLSGGIDSAVTCCLAVKALGKNHVTAVAMPSVYSSKSSVDDSALLADALGIDFKIIPITAVYDAYLTSLKDPFHGLPMDVTEENIQARIRGNILMALSNKFGWLTLSTGNKSEISVGYCTLYGDMSGGLSVISDVPKTMVYELARYINRKKQTIRENILTKPPSAELKPDQTDADTLPPYDILDRILAAYLDDQCSRQEIIDTGLDPATVDWVITAVNRNEYKRRQAAPGLKVTTRAFGVGRRMPVAARYSI